MRIVTNDGGVASSGHVAGERDRRSVRMRIVANCSCEAACAASRDVAGQGDSLVTRVAARYADTIDKVSVQVGDYRIVSNRHREGHAACSRVEIPCASDRLGAVVGYNIGVETRFVYRARADVRARYPSADLRATE